MPFVKGGTNAQLVPMGAREFYIKVMHPELYPNSPFSNQPKLAFVSSMAPLAITDGRDANWNEQTSIGRSEPYQIYSGGSAITYGFSVAFVAQTDPREDVINPCRWLQALQYPNYQGKFAPPPLCNMFVGNFFKARGIMKSVGVTWGGETWTDEFLPMSAEVSITFTETNSAPLGTSDFSGYIKSGRSKGYFNA